MSAKKKIIVVIEPSQIIRKGLYAAFSHLPFVDHVIELNTDRPLAPQLRSLRPDIIVANPVALGVTTENTPNDILEISKEISLVAVVNNLINNKLLNHFDAVINIYDDFDIIAEKLKTVVSESETSDSMEELSDREKEILVALTKGKSNKEIADFFNISIHTVITHRRNITRKLDIHSVSGLTVYAIVNKLIDIHDIKAI